MQPDDLLVRADAVLAIADGESGADVHGEDAEPVVLILGHTRDAGQFLDLGLLRVRVQHCSADHEALVVLQVLDDAAEVLLVASAVAGGLVVQLGGGVPGRRRRHHLHHRQRLHRREEHLPAPLLIPGTGDLHAHLGLLPHPTVDLDGLEARWMRYDDTLRASIDTSQI